MLGSLSSNPTFRSILFGAAIFTCLSSLAGFGGRFWWVLDLASHFRVQYLAVSLVLTLILLLSRNRNFAIVTGAFALLNISLILPLYFGPPPVTDTTAPKSRAMMMNVHTRNTNYSLVLDAIGHYAPDFLLVEEVDRRWLNDLKPLDAEYPYSVSRPRSDNFGIAFYSKTPILSADFLDIGEADSPSVLVRMQSSGRDLYFLGTHTLPPVNSAYARLRDIHLAELPSLVKSLDAPVLLMGDLNATPWSSPFRRLVQESELLDGSRGMGYQPTWPAGLHPLLIPIDHCLHSRELLVIQKTIGPFVGSDHYPVIVDFAFSGG